MTSRKPDPATLERLLSARSLTDPPRDVLQRALQLKALLPRAPESLGEWLVRLVFDSGMQPLPAGLRAGAATAPSERRLLFEARRTGETGAPRQVDIRVRRESGGDLEVAGQCLPPWSPEAGAVTVEVRSGKTSRRATLDDSGEFLLRRLPSRTESLSISWTAGDQLLLSLESVPVPEGPARRS